MSMADSPVSIQALSRSESSTPSWFGEAAVTAHYLRQVAILATIEEQVRFARRRFGYYDVIDFVVVLLGYAISGERTLEALVERFQPFAASFMALFGRDRLPHRSTLSRFLAALDQAVVEALRTVFLEDLVARPLEKVEKTGGLWDRHVLWGIWSRQRQLSRRIAAGDQGGQRVHESAISATEPRGDEAGRAIWQWRDCRRPCGTCLRHAGQGL